MFLYKYKRNKAINIFTLFEEVCLFSKKSSKDVILFYKKFQRLGLHASYFIKNAKVNYEKKMDKIYLFIKQVVMVEMRRQFNVKHF